MRRYLFSLMPGIVASLAVAPRCAMRLPMVAASSPMRHGPATASGAAAAVPLLILRGGSALAGEASGSQLAARALGWTLSAAALSVYTPIIGELVTNGKAPESMSDSTWALQSLGFATFVIFHVRMGFPLSTYVDFAALCVQSVAILGLSMFYRKRWSPMAALPIGGAIAAIALPVRGLRVLQVASTAITTWALLPQILSNFRARSRGGWSAISAGLSTAGNAGRLFTTVTLADSNLLLLGQFTAGLVLNGMLLVQSLIWD